MYMAINHAPNLARYNLRSLKGAISGAAPLPREVQTQFEALTGARLVEGYGLTEASPVTHGSPLEGEQRPGSIGVPLPSTEAAIFDQETGTRQLAARRGRRAGGPRPAGDARLLEAARRDRPGPARRLAVHRRSRVAWTPMATSASSIARRT